MRHEEKKPGVTSRMFAIFRENESIMRKLIRRIAPDPQEVDDIMQEAVLRALHAERAREISEPKAYLFSIVRHVVHDELEKKMRSIIDFIEDFGDQIDSPDPCSVDEQVDARERLFLFLEAVASVPQQCQRVFVLKKVYGYSHEEISRKLGISISTTEKHVAAGYKRCVEYLDRQSREKTRKAAGSFG
jgi:RNA polymerase sigma factor (sigma-70 family)